MNSKAKKRLVIVGLVLMAAVLVVLATVGAGSASKSVNVADAANGAYEGKKVQVSGSIVADSYSSDNNVANFDVVGTTDEEDTSSVLHVVYDGPLPSTFGTGVIAICTGIVEDGTITASDLVTKCPSKYESAEGSLTPASLHNEGSVIFGVEVKLAGSVVAGTIAEDGVVPRFELGAESDQVAVDFAGPLADEIIDGTPLVLTGALQEDGIFYATQVNVDESIDTTQETN